MGQEMNIESIRALEKRIEEGKGDTIKLKRARNSLLNISTRVPPEILGSIFAWIVARKRDFSLVSSAHFAGFEKGSYTFLLVCRHWFDVASRTPEVWTFWGNTLEEWNKWCCRNRAAPVDLVLMRSPAHPGIFRVSLPNALRDRATQDKIRQIHLVNHDPRLLALIFSSLTPEGEGAQEKRIESIIFRAGGITAELLNFFARSRLPNLRSLQIDATFSSPFYPQTNEQLQLPLWNYLPLSQPTRLISLSLRADRRQLPITASQLTSILTSIPNLEELELSHTALPGDIEESRKRIPLRNLRKIRLEGTTRGVFWLLNRLELPTALDSHDLHIENFTVEDVTRTIGPYVRNYFRRDNRFQGRLEVIVSVSSYDNFHLDGGPHRLFGLSVEPEETSQPTRFSTALDDRSPINPEAESLFLDLIALIPPEHVVSLETEHSTYSVTLPEDLLVAMPIETLFLHDVKLSDGFLRPNSNGPYVNTGLFPSLQLLHIEGLTVGDADWEPLTEYLAHQITPDDEVISLSVSDCPLMPPAVEKEIRDLVGEFDYNPVPESEDSEDEDKDKD